MVDPDASESPRGGHSGNLSHLPNPSNVREERDLCAQCPPSADCPALRQAWRFDIKLFFTPHRRPAAPSFLFAAENRIALEEQVVDLFADEHYKAPFEAASPNHLVPVLDDGDCRLTDSSAILKYLADKVELTPVPQWPSGARSSQRAHGVSFVALGELIGSDYSAYLNVKRWLNRMKQLASWKRVNEVIDGYGASLSRAMPCRPCSSSGREVLT